MPVTSWAHMRLAIATLRVFWGLVYFTNGLAKVVLGLAAPLGALLAALLALHLWFATFFNGHWLYEYPVEWVTLVCLAFMRPGRFYGLDAVFWRRGSKLGATFG